MDASQSFSSNNYGSWRLTCYVFVSISGIQQESAAIKTDATKTFETSTAVIKFTPGSPTSLSSSSSEEGDDNMPKPHHHHDDTNNCDDRSPGLSPSRVDRAGGQHWSEQSWKSDSGFNSDNTLGAVIGGGERLPNSGKNGVALAADASRPSTLPIDGLTLRESSVVEREGLGRTVDGENDAFRTNGVVAAKDDRGRTDDGDRGPHTEEEEQRLEALMKSDRFNPFNKVPFIEEEHFVSPTISNTPRYNFSEEQTEGDSRLLEPGRY